MNYMTLKTFTNAIAIYQYGSSTYPFIKNPEDIDYLVIYKTEKEVIDNYLLETTLRKEHPELHFFSIAVETLESPDLLTLHSIQCQEQNGYNWAYRFFRTSIAPLALILMHWARWIEGEHIDFKKYDKLTPKFLSIIENGLKVTKFKINRTVEKDGFPIKNWYYLFIAFYVYINESYEITEEQSKIINAAHDRKLTLEECWMYSEEIDLL